MANELGRLLIGTKGTQKQGYNSVAIKRRPIKGKARRAMDAARRRKNGGSNGGG